MGGKLIGIPARDGKTIPTYVADSQPHSLKPAILLYSAIFGLEDPIMTIADRWSDRGFVVAVPDYFFRDNANPGVLDRSEEGRRKAFERWNALDVDSAIEDMASVADHLKSNEACNGKIGALGYCAGGELAFLSATRLGAVAVATFHGTRIDVHLDEAHRITGQMTMHFGACDPLIPMERVEMIRAKFANNPDIGVYVYPGAAHGFSFAGYSYHEVAAVESDRHAQSVMKSMSDA
jgi:carboxymethylenebutenolidase